MVYINEPEERKEIKKQLIKSLGALTVREEMVLDIVFRKMFQIMQNKEK